MDVQQVQKLFDRINQLEHLLVVDRDHPKEETFSRKMYDVEMKLVNVHEKLDAILQQTTKTNGRVSRLEDDNILNKERISSHSKILGFGATDPLDKVANNVEGGWDISHLTGTTAATTQASELVVAMYAGSANDTTYTITGYSNVLNEQGADVYTSVSTAWKAVSSTGAQSGTFNSTEYMNGVGAIATFKEYSAPAPAILTDDIIWFE